MARKLSNTEFDNFVKTVLELRYSDPEPSLLQIIRIANDTLEPSKRRVILTVSQAKEEIKAVKALYALSFPRMEETSLKEKLPLESAPTVKPLEEPKTVPVKLSEGKQSVLSELETLKAEMNQIRNHLEAKIDSLREELSKLKQSLVKSRPRIGIGGLQPGQFRELNSNLQDKANLIQIDRDQARVHIPGNLDRVFLTRFISHKFSQQISDQGVDVEVVDGGLSNMRRNITNFLSL